MATAGVIPVRLGGPEAGQTSFMPGRGAMGANIWKNNCVLTTGIRLMFYRFALALGLFSLGMYLGRETARTAFIRTRLKQFPRSERLLGAPAGKTSLH